ncbi:hypothetical protein [Desulforamulus ruminis]|uniref:Uncharacterized protein n=1 Tax=Desulforamulus ruminis (strain ATCC 23193 / DSM 2154 / NCIMB 8452 / DL) TaxID=696281 RepID=F6DP04_DESRL|nr:hypothetical protein [Desulforamulus ruminis]AEG60723.1 hypothetical protein Desru_2492 [Desulforamulus ruminis DSM 2154]
MADSFYRLADGRTISLPKVGLSVDIMRLLLENYGFTPEILADLRGSIHGFVNSVEGVLKERESSGEKIPV